MKRNISIEKSLNILLLFSPKNQEMGTVEISKKLGLHKATVSRILATLTQFDFIQQNPRTKKFKLGHAVISLGTAVQNSISNHNIVYIAKPYLDDLRDRLKENIVFEILIDNEIVIGYMAEAGGPIRLRGSIGVSRPVHASAGAKAILAFSQTKKREQLLNRDLEQLTPNTIRDPKVLERQLEKIRMKGFSVDNEEVYLGINAVAAPIFDLEGTPIAAINVAGLSHAIKLENSSPIVNEIKKTAKKISKQLYYQQS
jgi:DNA-binding IclR family transcriptional regulator